ncbi:MAG: HAMP domain-containing protein [Candidatus Paracaedibacteraceae bacterium]|nr:HAMP domain-containing protein [Candidatus Paracaedibacteraceae bacterium]
MPKSLFGRSIIILLTPLIVVQVILSYIFFERHTDAILDSLAKGIVGDMQMVCDLVDQGMDHKQLAALAQRNFDFKVTIDPDGKVVKYGAYKDKWLYQYMEEQLNARLNHLYFLRIFGDVIHVKIPHERGVLTIETPRKRLYSRTTHLVIIWTAVSALLLFIVASLFMRNQIRPIRRLANAAEKFGKGLDVPFRAEGATEVRQAGLAFMIMRDRIKRHIQERTEMLAGVSHDLRTPLARMKLQLAMMEKNSEVSDLQSDVEEMQRMVQGFLDFSKGVGQEEIVLAEVRDVVDQTVARVRHLPLSVSIVGESSIVCPLKVELFKRCLTNLLLNSNRYGNNAIITIERSDKFLTLMVDDDGPGIPEDEWENVFRPFYRLDPARNLDSGGVGLGMSIARDVIRGHGGTMVLDKNEQGGLRVIIKIPC